MNKDVPAVIYANIYAMLPYRGITPDAPLDQDKFRADLSMRDYAVITGVRDIEKSGEQVKIKSIIVLFNEGTSKGQKTADFKKVLVECVRGNDAATCELMTVTEEPLNTHLEKAVIAFKYGTEWYIENHSYSNFIIEFPKHEIMDKHEIVPATELDQLLFDLKTDKSKLPKMLSKDTGAIWIGARAGQVVRVYRTSETAGTAIAYRLVR
jgi:DNA-directed RNA polymerase subunit H (RpoH/RPB5)